MSANVNALTICFICTHTQFIKCQFSPVAFASCTSCCNGSSGAIWDGAIPSRDACLDPNAGMLCLCTAALPCAVPQQLLVPAALCSHQGKHDFMSWGVRWSWLCIPHPCPDLGGVLHPYSLPWPSGLARGEPGRQANTPEWLWLLQRCQHCWVSSQPGVTLGCPNLKPFSSREKGWGWLHQPTCWRD